MKVRSQSFCLSLHDISLSIMSSSAIHDVINDNLSILFYDLESIIQCVSVCLCAFFKSIHLLINDSLSLFMNKWIQSVGVPPDEMKEWWLIHLLALWIMLQWTSVQFSSVTQSCPTLCDPMDCSTPGLPVHLKLMSIKSVMSSNHLILCHPFLCPPSIFPSIRVFSNESVLIRWPEYWDSVRRFY